MVRVCDRESEKEARTFENDVEKFKSKDDGRIEYEYQNWNLWIW